MITTRLPPDALDSIDLGEIVELNGIRARVTQITSRSPTDVELDEWPSLSPDDRIRELTLVAL